MQDALFADAEDPPRKPHAPRRAAVGPGPKVRPAAPDPVHLALAEALPPLIRLGTSSWTYPGWTGLVWDTDYADAVLSKHGLSAYVQHPLFRTVSLDRAFYRPLTVSQYAGYAAQVPDDFRFVVKAPSLVTDAMVRSETGRGMQLNPAFLNTALTVQEFVQPALEGLGHKLGALVFQLSPLPPHLLNSLADVQRRLHTLLLALPPVQPAAPDAVVAVEVRDAAFLTPQFAALLRGTGATYCLGLHSKMPPIEEQLPILRALWPGPLVCRWNLHRMHGAYGYEEAEKLYLPYDKLVDVDPGTRSTLAKVAAATAAAGHKAYITISNKAEGSAPRTVAGLAKEINRHSSARQDVQKPHLPPDAG